MIALRDSIGSDFVETTESFFGERTSGQGEKFRATSAATANGGSGGAGAGRGATSGGGSRHWRRQIAGVSRSRGPVRARTKEKAIISTHTINLQEQLLYKDIPILQKVLPETFEAALIKGRQNYVCPRRLLRAREQQNDLFTGPEQNELEEISALGGANARRDAERFVFRAKREGLGASLQRGPHLHQEILWAKRPLLLPARPAKIRERADRSYQSHAAFHAPGRGGGADGTGERISVPQRFPDFGRGAYG